MAGILAENLSGKAVTGADGAELGSLYNITMNLKTGMLSNLVVDPNDRAVREDLDFEADEAGHLLIPVGRVQAVKDHIIVRR